MLGSIMRGCRPGTSRPYSPPIVPAPYLAPHLSTQPLGITSQQPSTPHPPRHLVMFRLAATAVGVTAVTFGAVTAARPGSSANCHCQVPCGIYDDSGRIKGLREVGIRHAGKC